MFTDFQPLLSTLLYQPSSGCLLAIFLYCCSDKLGNFLGQAGLLLDFGIVARSKRVHVADQSVREDLVVDLGREAVASSAEPTS